jgi:tetratricopeptide (TPR) repeat protein
MSQLQERIAQFRKMATDDPDNELGHFRLGQLLMEAGQFDEAIQSFQKTLTLSPQFSKVYQLQAQCLIQLKKTDEAIELLKKGFAVADERGDKMPRDEMAKLLVQLGQPAPTPKEESGGGEAGPEGGFRCQRPGCWAGSRARQLPKPPMPDEVGKKIHENVCADCWNLWFRDYSIKVINELHLDLSTEFGQEEYDRYMREFFGFTEHKLA